MTVTSYSQASQHFARTLPGEEIADQVQAGEASRLLSVTVWIGEIKKVWARGPASTLELARVMCAIRDQSPRGGWTALWRSDQMPFGKSKGAMLLVIGDGLSWANIQTFGRLPIGWSILYHLARLDRTTLERLIQEGLIHPALTLEKAKQLVAQIRGKTINHRSLRAKLRERLRRFEDFVRANLPDWSGTEKQLVLETLSRLIEQIGASDDADFKGDGEPQILEPAH